MKLLSLVACTWVTDTEWEARTEEPCGEGPDCPVDADGDGVASVETGGADCWDDPDAIPFGFAAINNLSQPIAADVHPGAEDAPYDGVDADCAGDGDFDADGDGHTTDAWPDGDGGFGDDCDDTSAGVFPGAQDEPYDEIDADCAGDDDLDADGDGHRSDAHGGDDCDDTDATVNPDVLEVCGDRVDDDCSGTPNDADALGCEPYFADGDGDGYYADGAESACLCEPDEAFVAEAGDCDDADPAVSPGATESCATLADDDCDGETDARDAVECVEWHRDDDGDAFGGASACWCQPTGDYTIADGSDCDDADPWSYPGAVELCDGVQNDCDDGAWSDDGLASLYDGAAWTDVTAAMQGTSHDAPQTYGLPPSGELWICAGTWYTKLVGSGDVVDVYGLDGAARTTLTATGSVVSVTNGSVTLSGLTLTGGTGTGSTTTYGGGAIAVATTTPESPTLTLDGCVVRDNTADYGGGLAAYSYGEIALVDTEVSDNTAVFEGGGAWVSSGALDCTGAVDVAAGFWINSAGTGGGGVWLDRDEGRLTAADCDFGEDVDDNVPDDVSAMGEASGALGDDVSVECSGASGC